MPSQKQTKSQIGVVGAGNMGAGIAQKYAMEGFFVTVCDLSDTAVLKAEANINKSLDEAVRRKIIHPKKLDSIKSNLNYQTKLENLKNCELIIEAIFENFEAKQDLFANLEKICENNNLNTILASNTSSFLIEDLSTNLKKPENFLGLHYFFHPAKNKLVEIIKNSKTSLTSFNKAYQIQEQVNKIPIVSEDAPGFIVNRFFVPWLNESMRLLEESKNKNNLNIASIDQIAKKTFRIGAGPFELMNMTGVPITFHAANALADKLGDFYKPCDLILEHVENKTNWDLTNLNQPDLDTESEATKARLLGCVFYLATQIVFEEKICTIEDIELGARIGLRWKAGPFELMNNLGFDRSIELICKFCETYPELRVPKMLFKLSSFGQKEFPILAVHTEVKNQTGIIKFNKPDAMNALDETLITQLDAAFTQLDQDENIENIVITGRGKAFVAGADIGYFVHNMKNNNVSKIVNFATHGQEIFKKIANSKKTVVAALNGLALGGGLELALACDYIIASNKAVLGFPETSIGIYPGLGGTQRTPRRVGLENARWLILSGELIKAQKALEIGLVDQVVESSQVLEEAFIIAERHSGPDPESRGKCNISQDFSKAINHKAPIAIQLAEELLALSQKLDLSAGLKAESERLNKIFSTQDALKGLSAVGKKEKPLYLGN